MRSRFLVGTDGGRSLVRQLLGIEFPGETLGLRAIVADANWRASAVTPEGRLISSTIIARAQRGTYASLNVLDLSPAFLCSPNLIPLLAELNSAARRLGNFRLPPCRINGLAQRLAGDQPLFFLFPQFFPLEQPN